MKLLLTSGGLMNESIIKALRELCVADFQQLNVAFIPTAANIEAGDKWWMIEDLLILKKLEFKSIDIVDISAIPQDLWIKRLENANILFFEGGNNYHLKHWINKSGLTQALPELLKTRVYVGVSAGSMVVSKSLIFGNSEKPFAEKYDGSIGDEGLGLVDFLVKPHINSKYFPDRNFETIERESKGIKFPVYALDDNSAVVVHDNSVSVVSEGEWKMFN